MSVGKYNTVIGLFSIKKFVPLDIKINIRFCDVQFQLFSEARVFRKYFIPALASKNFFQIKGSNSVINMLHILQYHRGIPIVQLIVYPL